MDGKLMLDCLVILISALAAVIPTSRMLFKDQGPEEIIMDGRPVVGYSMYALLLQKRAVIGNVGAMVLLLFYDCESELLMKLQVWIFFVALIGFFWASCRFLKWRLMRLKDRIEFGNNPPDGPNSNKEYADEINKADFGDLYLFQAEVFEVRKDRLLIKDVSIRTQTGWFPYSYPTENEKKPMDLLLSKKQMEEGITIVQGDKISFTAMIYVSMRDSDAMRNVSMIGFQLQQHHMLNVITDFKTSMVSDENRIRSWYLAELAVCRACPFAVACEYRKNPCIIMTSDGKWNRAMLQKEHPELIEEALAKISKQASEFDGYLGMMLDQESKHRAKKLGFRDAGVIVYFSPRSSAIRAGCRICFLDGIEINTIDQLSSVLKKHKAGDVLSITVEYPTKGKLQKEVTLVDKSQLTKLIFDKEPFRGEHAYKWWFR